MNVAAAGWSRKLGGVTTAELRLLAEAQVVLVRCQLAKWLRPQGQLIGLETAAAQATGGAVDRPAVPSARKHSPGIRSATGHSIGWAVTRAARYGVFRPQCLVRSMAIQRMLRRRGIADGNLHIGVRTQDGEFQAHAWIELDGMVIGDTRQHVSTFTKVTDHRLVEL